MAKDEDVVALARAYCTNDRDRFKYTLQSMAANAKRANHAHSAGVFKYWAQQVGGGLPLEMPYQLRGLLTQNDVDDDLCSVDDGGRLLYGRHVPTTAEADALQRLVSSYLNAEELYDHHVTPANRALFYGAPGTGKSSSAELLASALELPLYHVRTSGLIDSLLGKSLTNLDTLFDGISDFTGVWVFDEFDSLAQNRRAVNDVAEMRRVTALFLERIENLHTRSIIVCTTNAPDIMDPALVRRFDVAVEFTLPNEDNLRRVWENETQWTSLDVTTPDGETLRHMVANDVSQADLVSAIHAAVRDLVCMGTEPSTKKICKTAILRAADARKLKQIGYL